MIASKLVSARIKRPSEKMVRLMVLKPAHSLCSWLSEAAFLCAALLMFIRDFLRASTVIASTSNLRHESLSGKGAEGITTRNLCDNCAVLLARIMPVGSIRPRAAVAVPRFPAGRLTVGHTSRRIVDVSGASLLIEYRDSLFSGQTATAETGGSEAFWLAVQSSELRL
jgi:hypothetical protein